MKTNKPKILSYKKKQITVNVFKKMATQHMNSVQDEQEIMKTDLTMIFLKELDRMISSNEIIIMQINGKMRLGKSTMAFALGDYIFELLINHGFRKKGETFGIKNIARDQNEKLQYMLDPKNEFNILTTDEFNEMEDSGLNMTANNKLLGDFSNIQAGRYVHGINVQPLGIADPNTDIVLEVISVDKENRTTICKFFYRLPHMGTMIEVLLGRVEIPVGHIIEVWEDKVKKHFNKPNKSIKDEAIIQKYAKTNWYVDYVVRKYKKMELVNKHGIMRPRDLQYAEMQFDIINEFKDLTKSTKMNSATFVKSMLKPYLIKKKIPTSILGVKEASEDIFSVLLLYGDSYKCEKEYKILKLKKGKCKSHEEREIIIDQMKDMLSYMALVKEKILMWESHYRQMVKLKKEYDSIEEK